MKIKKTINLFFLSVVVLFSSGTTFAQESTLNRLKAELISPWLVTIQDKKQTLVLRISEIKQKDTNTFALDASFAVTGADPRQVEAEVIQTENERKLLFKTQSGNRYIATQTPKGTFEGLYKSPSGISLPVFIERLSADDIRTQLESARKTDITKPTWQDIQTGLMWTVCPYGEALVTRFNGAQVTSQDCSSYEAEGGKSISLTWWDAILKARSVNYDGQNDWRIPTIDEILSIYKCKLYVSLQELKRNPNTKVQFELEPHFDENNRTDYYCKEGQGSPQFIDAIKIHPNSSIWTSSSMKDAKEEDRRIAITHQGIVQFESKSPFYKHRLLLVRGGKPSDKWITSVKEAEVAAIQSTKAIKERDQLIAKETAKIKSQEAEEANENNRKKQAYMAATAKLRASVKRGERISKGLVLEVKGDLILVQTYEDVCISYSANINPFSHQRDCITSKKSAAGNEWINRSEIFPAR